MPEEGLNWQKTTLICLPVRILEDIFTGRVEKANNKQACHQNIPFIPCSHASILFYLLLFLPPFTLCLFTHFEMCHPRCV